LSSYQDTLLNSNRSRQPETPISPKNSMNPTHSIKHKMMLSSFYHSCMLLLSNLLYITKMVSYRLTLNALDSRYFFILLFTIFLYDNVLFLFTFILRYNIGTLISYSDTKQCFFISPNVHKILTTRYLSLISDLALPYVNVCRSIN